MAEANIVVNYIEIIQAIGEQIQSVWFALKDTENEEIKEEIKNIKAIEVSDEQSFNKKRNENKIDRGTIYIVAKFGSGSTNFGSSVTPITLLAIGTANKVKPAQLLLGVFASAWTTKNLNQGLEDAEHNSLEISYASQVWNTPEVVTNFNEIDANYRNLFRVTGFIISGTAAVRVGTITYFYNENNNYPNLPAVGWEQFNILAVSDAYRASLDTQPFGNTKGFAQSEVNFSTYTFSVSTYLLTNHISAASLSIKGFRNRTKQGIGAIFKADGTQKVPGSDDTAETYFVVHKNGKLKLKIDFTNGYTNLPVTTETEDANDDVLASDFFSYFKIVDAQIRQEIANIPMLTITFTR